MAFESPRQGVRLYHGQSKFYSPLRQQLMHIGLAFEEVSAKDVYRVVGTGRIFYWPAGDYSGHFEVTASDGETIALAIQDISESEIYRAHGWRPVSDDARFRCDSVPPGDTAACLWQGTTKQLVDGDRCPVCGGPVELL